MAQIHKKFTDEQVKELMERYLNKTIERKYVQAILGIGKVRFFAFLKRYRQDPQNFSVQYHRRSKPRISASVENNIIKELKADKKLIQNPDVPLKSYNYSFVRNRLETSHGQKVSLTTIIRRAKKHDFYLGKRKKATHDREVLTNYVGELIQHDSSHHLFAPAAEQKWYLITSLDDYSRRILYGDLFETESSWLHIRASKALITRFGCPFSYYVDSHSIFRFVQGRDSIWRKHHLLTDQADTQWKQVMNDCRIESSIPYPPRPKVRSNALTAGSKTTSSEPVPARISPTSNKPAKCSIRNSTATITTSSTPPPKKSLTSASKKPSAKTSPCSGRLKSLPLSSTQRTSSASDSNEPSIPTGEFPSTIFN